MPEPLFQAAEELAQRLDLSRNQLYNMALEAFVTSHRPGDDVTASLNRVYSRESSELDPNLARMQSASIPRDDWS